MNDRITRWFELLIELADTVCILTGEWTILWLTTT